MICKHCEKEVPFEAAFCPFCGSSLEAEAQMAEEVLEVAEESAALPEEFSPEEGSKEELPVEESPAEEASEEEIPAEKPKAKVWKWVLAIAGGIVLLGVLVTAVLYGLGVIDLEPKTNDIFYSSVYTADEETVIAKKDKVVATMGDKELTNGELQLYYQNLIYSFYSQYGSYLSYIGLDLSQPLSTQMCGMDAAKTWEQYFVEGALKNWENYTVVELLVEEAGFEVEEDLRAALDGMREELTTYAEQGGFDSVEAYIQDGVGPNVDFEDYTHFNEVYYVSNEYLNSFYDTDYPTADEIEAYFAENEATFAENGITKDMGLQSSVRHLLVNFEGGTEGEDGTVTYSDDEKAAAYAKAEELLNQWKAGEATEDSFAALVTEHTDDTASAATGGLYENINADASYVENFLSWSIDAARQPGDTGIVESPYGYHIMYFVKGEEYWPILVGDEVVADRIQALLTAAQEKYPAAYKYKNICLYEPDLMG